MTDTKFRPIKLDQDLAEQYIIRTKEAINWKIKATLKNILKALVD